MDTSTSIANSPYPTGTAGSAGRTSQSRINSPIGWFLIGLVVLAPLPFASVRPFLWALSAALIGLCTVIYVAVALAQREQPRVSWASIALPASLFAAFCAAIVIQLIPFASFTMETADGIRFYTPQISIAPGNTILSLLAYLSYGFLFWLMLQVGVNDKRRVAMLNTLLAAILAYAALGLIALQAGDTILGLQKWAYAGVATGPFVNRNSFATFLAFGAVLALSNMAGVLKRSSERHVDDGQVPHGKSMVVLYGVAYAFLIVTIVATQSRMGLMATILGSLVVALLSVRLGRRVGRIAVLISVAVALLAIALAFYGGGLLERVGSLDHDSSIRSDLYGQVLHLIGQRPVTGFGAGTFSMAFPLVHTPPVSPDLVWSRAHNSYLTLWSDMGLIAGSLPMLILIIFALWLLRSAMSGEGSLRAETTGLGVLVVGASHSLVDFSLEIHANALIFVAILGLSVSTVLKTRKRTR